jgi:hypothetical protein
MSGGERRGHAASAAAADPRLRSRTYAIPFEQVWQAALRLTGGGLRGWTAVAANDGEGEITAIARGLSGAEHDVHVHISLDEDAQTVVQAEVTARKPGADYGRAGRRLRRLLTALDRAVAAPAAARRTAGRSA